MAATITLSALSVTQTSAYDELIFFALSSENVGYIEYSEFINASAVAWNVSAMNVIVAQPSAYLPAGGSSYTLWTKVIPWTSNEYIKILLPRENNTYAIQVTGYSVFFDGVSADIFQEIIYEVLVVTPFESVEAGVIYDCEYSTYSIVLSSIETLPSTTPVVWDVTTANKIFIDSAYDKNGNYYVLGSEGIAYDLNYITLNITPPIADGVALDPITFSAYLSARNTNGVNCVNTFDFTIEEFPPESVLKPRFRLNNEDPYDVEEMYRVYDVGNTFLTQASAHNLSTINNILSGQLVFKQVSADAEYISVSTFNHPHTTVDYIEHNLLDLYTSDISGESTLSLVCSSVSCALWLFAHSVESDDLIYNSITYWPSAIINVWPQYTWRYDLDQFVENTINDSSGSQGASAYGDGAVLTFYLSSHTYDFSTYNWQVGDTLYPGISDKYAINMITNTSTPTSHQVRLEIFNSELPSTMVKVHTADGYAMVSSYYPNIAETTQDYGDILNENIKIYHLNKDIVLRFNVNDSLIVFPLEDTLVASPTCDFVNINYSPIRMSNSIRYDWNLIAPEWASDQYTYQTSPCAQFEFSLGNGTDELTVRADTNITTTLSCRAQVYLSIPYTGSSITSYINSPLSSIDIITLYPNVFTFNKYVSADTANNVSIETLLSYNSADVLPFIKDLLWGSTCTSVTGVSTTFTPFRPSATSLGWHSIRHSISASNDQLITSCYNNIYKVVDYPKYNENINRIYGSTQLSLPYIYETLKIGDNEIITYDVLNETFDKLLENLDYLEDMCQLYSAPPTELYGWLGNSSISKECWHVAINNIDNEYNSLTACIDGNLSNIVDLVVKSNSISENTIYIASKNKIQVLDNKYIPTILGERTYHSIGINYSNLVGIAVDSEDNIFIADSDLERITIYSFNTDSADPWKIIYSFGGIGLQSSKYGFDGLSDIFVDTNENRDYLYVADKNNKCIKKYSSTGSWIWTLDLGDNEPISITLDSDENMYILTNNSILLYDSNREYVSAITNSILLEPTYKIRISNDLGFLYVVLSDRIEKFEINGTYAGSFGITEITGTKSYTGVWHDSYKNLYIANQNNIIMYIDMLDIISVKLDTSSYYWDLDHIHLKKDEFLQDWVVNKSLARLWDIHEIFRRSIIGKLYYKNIRDEVYELQIRTFRVGEYTEFPWVKDDIYVGLNEITASEVLNRCIKRFYDNQVMLLSLIQE